MTGRISTTSSSGRRSSRGRERVVADHEHRLRHDVEVPAGAARRCCGAGTSSSRRGLRRTTFTDAVRVPARAPATQRLPGALVMISNWSPLDDLRAVEDLFAAVAPRSAGGGAPAATDRDDRATCGSRRRPCGSPWSRAGAGASANIRCAGSRARSGASCPCAGRASTPPRP